MIGILLGFAGGTPKSKNGVYHFLRESKGKSKPFLTDKSSF
ncbi:hypothetical protein PSKAS_11050 [Peribacillus sp. N1]